MKKDRVLISVAETYDVLIRPPGPGAYELRATAQDGSAWASSGLVKARNISRPTCRTPIFTTRWVN